MLAIRKLARGIANVNAEKVPVPIAGPEEIVAEVDSAGICGTDLHIYLDEFETAPPVTLGHEFAGRIVEVGTNVRGWQHGDRVTAGTYALKFMAEGKINVRRLITHRFPLEAWDQALQTAQKKQGVKILPKPSLGHAARDAQRLL